MIVMRDGHGDPVVIQGYAAVFGARSRPLAERAGRREVIVPGAFSPAEFGRVVARFGHTSAGQQCLTGATLKLRQDNAGLAFSISAIPATVHSAGLVNGIGAGELTGASFMASLSGEFLQCDDGERVYAVTKARGLEDIAISAAAVYPLPGCWLAHAERLPARLAGLRDLWTEEGGV